MNTLKKVDAPNDPVSMLSIIATMATRQDVDVDKLERFLAMKERQDAKEAEQAFNESMRKAQAEMRTIGRDARNSQTNSGYATFDKLDQALRPIYTNHGFSLSFDTDAASQDGYIKMMCYVAHDAGHTRTYKADLPADGKGAKGGDVMTKTHAFGSATSYGRRYLLQMIFNVALGEKDDDGNSASGVAAISFEQESALRDMLTATNSSEAQFCRFLKIPSLDRLREDRYEVAVAELRSKAKRQGVQL